MGRRKQSPTFSQRLRNRGYITFQRMALRSFRKILIGYKNGKRLLKSLSSLKTRE
jgi:hypothetical protein